ncbi:MAG: hypothetical protein GC136_06515 [Alphaproteobacteria bacterium]|nr:hypothetical protein [Alphaproteobacteria bacterium]
MRHTTTNKPDFFEDLKKDAAGRENTKRFKRFFNEAVTAEMNDLHEFYKENVELHYILKTLFDLKLGDLSFEVGSINWQKLGSGSFVGWHMEQSVVATIKDYYVTEENPNPEKRDLTSHFIFDLSSRSGVYNVHLAGTEHPYRETLFYTPDHFEVAQACREWLVDIEQKAGVALDDARAEPPEGWTHDMGIRGYQRHLDL